MELDAIDRLADQAFDGFIVRKDLVRKFKGQYPVPTYALGKNMCPVCGALNLARQMA